MAQKITDLLGVYDNLHDAPSYLNNASNILSVTITFMCLSWICALMRLYTRFFIVRAPGWDDVFVILSLLSTSIGSGAICAAVTHGGMGQHYLLLPEATMVAYLRIFYVANASYPTSAGLIKMALLFQYLRVYEKGTWMRKIVIGVTIFVAFWCSAYSFLSWVPTIPVTAYWNLEASATRYAYGSEYVEPFVMTYTTMTASNMVLDLIILGLAAPILIFKKEGDDKRSRWSLLSLFSVGGIASVISMCRLISIIKYRAATYPTFDPTWYGATAIVFAALEVDIATITAALPVFWPVLRNISLNQILVTKEVNINVEHRRLSSGSSGKLNKAMDDDAIELHTSVSNRSQGNRSGNSNFSEAGRDGLQSDLRQKDYYQDPYILAQIDPLRNPDFGVTSEVRHGHGHGGKGSMGA